MIWLIGTISGGLGLLISAMDELFAWGLTLWQRVGLCMLVLLIWRCSIEFAVRRMRGER